LAAVLDPFAFVRGFLRAVSLAVAFLGVAAAPGGKPAELFSSYRLITLQVTAPWRELFDHARQDDSFNVPAKVAYADEAGRNVVIEHVSVSLRGNTSRRETECPFPKLKIRFDPPPHETIFADLSTVKVGTHCGDADGDTLTPRYGRLANENSPLREAFIYRLLHVVDVPSLRARPAQISYIDTADSQGAAAHQTLTRHAMLLEDDDDAKKRYGVDQEIKPEAFTSAHDAFAADDVARLAFAEALIGNFDWCLKMTSDDSYRCDARRKLWNVLALNGGGRTVPLIYDFDVSGMVAGRHSWFARIFNESFLPSRSQPEIEVLSQLQRTRTLFDRALLDRTRKHFRDRKAEVYRALDDAALDSDGREKIREYVDSFFRGIESNDAFYRPVVTGADTKAYRGPDRAAVVCENLGPIPVGTPVSEFLETNGNMVRVALLDALWHWAPPVQCPEIRNGSVWIERAAVSTNFPAAQ
jgi:hypothetical protein